MTRSVKKEFPILQEQQSALKAIRHLIIVCQFVYLERGGDAFPIIMPTSLAFVIAILFSRSSTSRIRQTDAATLWETGIVSRWKAPTQTSGLSSVRVQMCCDVVSFSRRNFSTHVSIRLIITSFDYDYVCRWQRLIVLVLRVKRDVNSGISTKQSLFTHGFLSWKKVYVKTPRSVPFELVDYCNILKSFTG